MPRAVPRGDAPAMEAQGCEMNAPDVAAALFRAGAQSKPLADVLTAQKRKL